MDGIDLKVVSRNDLTRRGRCRVCRQEADKKVPGKTAKPRKCLDQWTQCIMETGYIAQVPADHLQETGDATPRWPPVTDEEDAGMMRSRGSNQITHCDCDAPSPAFLHRARYSVFAAPISTPDTLLLQPKVTEGSELGDIFGSPVLQKSKISPFCEIVVTYLADWFRSRSHRQLNQMKVEPKWSQVTPPEPMVVIVQRITALNRFLKQAKSRPTEPMAMHAEIHGARLQRLDSANPSRLDFAEVEPR
ncbi:hypothetical protein C8R45DRAFT_929489 [Mycena sanguinolenta]|nr:hypothetical protein C8R45DRAFT_929489 [Mycena sanguinolenta]